MWLASGDDKRTNFHPKTAPPRADGPPIVVGIQGPASPPVAD
jgi:hypothetical protein